MRSTPAKRISLEKKWWKMPINEQLTTTNTQFAVQRESMHCRCAAMGDRPCRLDFILIILLIILLLGGFSGRFGGYGYGFGHGGIGILGVILIVLLVLLLMGRL